jgi:hypothetical protein
MMSLSPDQTCERCGDPLEMVEVSTFAGPRKWIAGRDCPCPRPRCPFCSSALDAKQRCTDDDCFMWDTVIPLPVMR